MLAESVDAEFRLLAILHIEGASLRSTTNNIQSTVQLEHGSMLGNEADDWPMHNHHTGTDGTVPFGYTIVEFGHVIRDDR
jgi:hypothetical protein